MDHQFGIVFWGPCRRSVSCASDHRDDTIATAADWRSVDDARRETSHAPRKQPGNIRMPYLSMYSHVPKAHTKAKA